MSAIRDLLAQVISPLTLVRARAKVLARQDRHMRSELMRIRRQNDMTQKDVAAALGITPQAVQKLERYDADPKLSTLRRYANAVGAIVEHRVSADIGQSVVMADASPWESASAVNSAQRSWQTSPKPARPSVTSHRGSAWSEATRTSYALGA